MILRLLERFGAIPCLLIAIGVPGQARAQACEGPSAQRPLAPSRDLYCIELIAAPGISGASGRVELRQPQGPFTISVTPSGALRQTLVTHLAGLPSPASLGPYTIFVAWAATPVMFPVTRLGAVTNGRTTLPTIEHEKFIVLITAEASPDVAEPAGRIVLRGASPSTRLQPPDVMQFTLGAASVPAAAGGHGAHAHSDTARSSADSLRWTTVPMPPGLAMLPAEMTLRPSVAPYLPRGGVSAYMPDGLAAHARASLATATRCASPRALCVDRSRAGALQMFAFNDQYPGPLLRGAAGRRDHRRAHERARPAHDGALARCPARQRNSTACPT